MEVAAQTATVTQEKVCLRHSQQQGRPKTHALSSVVMLYIYFAHTHNPTPGVGDQLVVQRHVLALRDHAFPVAEPVAGPR